MLHEHVHSRYHRSLVAPAQVHHLGRELLQERTKVKALSEELENPLNVHRWRKLEGSDPATYEMIQKIQVHAHSLATLARTGRGTAAKHNPF